VPEGEQLGVQHLGQDFDGFHGARAGTVEVMVAVSYKNIP
jgi:hypothetical protein